MDQEIVKKVPANEVGDRVKVWMGSNPTAISIVKDGAGTYTIIVVF
jgi:hypothetical protein